MNERQKRFVEEYLVDLNATQAAIRAGYSEKTATEQGARLLTNVKVQAAIQAAKANRSEEVSVKAIDVVRELTNLALLDVGEVLDFTGPEPRLKPANEIPERARRAISKIKVRRVADGNGEFAREVELTEFSFWDKTRSLELLGRHLDMFTDRSEVLVKSDQKGVPIDPSKLNEEQLRQLRDLLAASEPGCESNEAGG